MVKSTSAAFLVMLIVAGCKPEVDPEQLKLQAVDLGFACQQRGISLEKCQEIAKTLTWRNFSYRSGVSTNPNLVWDSCPPNTRTFMSTGATLNIQCVP